MSPVRVLLADDDPAVRDALGRALEVEGYDVSLAVDGARALSLVVRDQPDAVVLDVLMPMVDGLEVCRRLRGRGDRTPVLIVTAQQAVDQRVDGLDAGADDYLVKPFDLDELLARLRALLRRAYPADGGRLTWGPLSLDPVSRQVEVEGGTVSLTRTEAALLELFLRNPNQVLTRDLVEERIWGGDLGPASNSLDVYVGYLRRKLEQDGQPRFLHTVRGVGYRLGRAGEQ